MRGEEAVWRLKLGSPRVARGQPTQALPDLIAASEAETLAWVKGNAHVELGKIADLEGDRAQAKERYERG